MLEIDGRRSFGYRTTYFETPDLRCFVDHVEDKVPRFKARTRLYENSGECVQLKRGEGETDKRQIDYSQADREHLTEAARGCIESALADAGLQAPEELNPSLTTSFDRVTLSARTGSERMTCDLGIRLVGAHSQTAQMHEDLVLIETKSETGESPAERELAAMRITPISLSKYRVGMSLVGAARECGDQPGSDLFE